MVVRVQGKGSEIRRLIELDHEKASVEGQLQKLPVCISYSKIDCKL